MKEGILYQLLVPYFALQNINEVNLFFAAEMDKSLNISHSQSSIELEALNIETSHSYRLPLEAFKFARCKKGDIEEMR